MLTPPIPVVLPVAVAILLAACNRILPRWLASLVAILTATGALFAAIALGVFTRDATYIVWSAGRSPFGLSLVIDATSAMLCILASLLVVATVIFSHRYCANAGGWYHALVLLMLSGMCGFCETGDLGNLAVFFFLMCGAAFLLCRHDPEDRALPAGARRFGIAAGAGGCLLLLGIALLFGKTGSLNMAQAGRALEGHADPTAAAAFLLCLCGCLLLAAVVPFHFWMSDAHAIAPAPICALLSGILVEVGLYGAVRLYWVIFAGALGAWQSDLRNVLAVVGAVTAIAGALLCYSQRHLKRLLALSTVSHMGIVVMAVALLTPAALAGAAIFVMGHALLKGALFLAAGIVLHRFASLDELHLRGRGRHLRWTGTLFFVAAAGLAGLPPFGAFWGSVMMDGAAFHAGYGWIPWVAGISAMISAAAIFRFSGSVFFGWGPGPVPVEDAVYRRSRSHTPPALYGATTVLVVLGLASGLAPRLTGAAYAAALHLEDRAAYQQRVLDLLAPFPAEVHDQPASGGDILASIGSVLAAILLGGAGRRMRFPFVPGHTVDPSSVR